MRGAFDLANVRTMTKRILSPHQCPNLSLEQHVSYHLQSSNLAVFQCFFDKYHPMKTDVTTNTDDNTQTEPRWFHPINRARANFMRRAAIFIRSRSAANALLISTAFTLLILHGFFDTKFKVDQTSLGLLAIIAIPVLSQFASSLKAGGVEVAFRDLSVNDQLFKFLDSIATKRQWTYFSPREGEEHLGPAFAVFTEQLLSSSRKRLIQQLQSWLRSDDVNHRWFAAEIIGFHKIAELRTTVGRAPMAANPDEDLETWELNCIWAKARLDTTPYLSLKLLLQKTNSRNNQAWILRAFDQMISAELEEKTLFEDDVLQFIKRLSDEGVPSSELTNLFQGLQHLSYPTSQITTVSQPGVANTTG